MDKTTGAILAAFVCEGLVGPTLGIALREHVLTKCNKVEAVIAFAGGMIGAWYIGRKINKEVCEYCDNNFGSDACKVMGWK